MIAPPSSLVSLVQPWADYYSDSHFAQTVVTFAHVGALLVGGGIAIATDRGTLRATSDVDRRRHLMEVVQVHRVVLAALATVVVSGLLLLAADLETFWGSWIFWVKMSLVVLLLVNGARMQRIEASAARDTTVPTAHWGAIRGTALVSLALWLTITLAGVALINYA